MLHRPMAEGPSEVSYAPLSPKDAAMEFHWERHKECDGVVISVLDTKTHYASIYRCLGCKCMITVDRQGVLEEPYDKKS